MSRDKVDNSADYFLWRQDIRVKRKGTTYDDQHRRVAELLSGYILKISKWDE